MRRDDNNDDDDDDDCTKILMGEVLTSGRISMVSTIIEDEVSLVFEVNSPRVTAGRYYSRMENKVNSIYLICVR